MLCRLDPHPHLASKVVALTFDAGVFSTSQYVIRFAFREAELRRVRVLAVCALADAPTTLDAQLLVIGSRGRGGR